MRIALLNDPKNGYEAFMLKICDAVGAEAVILQWTEDLEKDVEQIRSADVDYVIIHGHANQHGFKLAPMVLQQLKIEPLVISSAGYSYPIEYPIFVGHGGDYQGDDNLQKAVAQIRVGPITHGGAARCVIERVCEMETQLAQARLYLQAAEQAERGAQECKRKYLILCKEISQRQLQRAKK